ncbi:hypothetical protein [Pelagicoccus sp. SDUM812005]|uniref:5' nucleotidase, NT5C type n=1 Tax=Pelagicoccus sp. SDUM812005 TaxID=3041257 RepID=UPI00280FEE9D|nr:hypothetical protein [Pelagicoccus sp. SDUM812005]MDQ8180388.1 hypothetical protein [Pelagicoccus sp. SDUM812005]
MKLQDIKQAQHRAHELKDPKLFEKILVDLQKLSKKDAENFFGAKLTRLDCYYMLGRWKDLADYSLELIKNDEEDPLAYLGAAQGLSKLGRKEEAAEMLNKSLEIWPDNYETLKFLGSLEGGSESTEEQNDAPQKGRIIYVGMDDVLCDYSTAHDEALHLHPEVQFPQSIPGFFENLPAIDGAVDAVNELRKSYDLYILTAPSTRNPTSYSEKRIWIEEHFDYELTKRLIICPNKGLLIGDFLIDDRSSGKGQENFKGQLIQFGSTGYRDWETVVEYFHCLPEKPE